MDASQRVMEEVNQCVLDSIRNGRYTRGATLLVAVSGGLDSMVLLHALLHSKAIPKMNILAVHVNHGIRPNSAEDAKFVQDICRQWNVTVVVRDVQLGDIPRHASKGVEADARELRYRVLTGEAQQVGATCVFMAHHADDQTETVLWRIIRGTSVRGLAGMRGHAVRRGVWWLRPLLALEKKDLFAYATQCHVPYVEDETNMSTVFVRNYLRLDVIPRLKKIQPKLNEQVTHLIQMAREDDEYLHLLSERWIAEHVRRDAQEYRVPIANFKGLARPLQRRVIHILLYCLASEDWTRTHVHSILALANATSPSGMVNLPNGYRAFRQYDWLRMGPMLVEGTSEYRIPWQLHQEASLVIPNSTGKRNWQLHCERWNSTDGFRVSSPYEVVLPDVNEVTVRSADTSSRIEKMGMTGSKKLQDVFVDAKVPRTERLAWPVLERDGHLIWVPGLARSRHLLVNPVEESTGWKITAVPPASE